MYGGPVTFGWPGTAALASVFGDAGDVGGAGELRTARLLTAIDADDLYVFHDLYPGNSEADGNVDHAAVTGQHVIVLDTKTWRPGAYFTDQTGAVWRTDRNGGWESFEPGEASSVSYLTDLLSDRIDLDDVTFSSVLVIGSSSGDDRHLDLSHYQGPQDVGVITVTALASWLSSLATAPADPVLLDRMHRLVAAEQVLTPLPAATGAAASVLQAPLQTAFAEEIGRAERPGWGWPVAATVLALAGAGVLAASSGLLAAVVALPWILAAAAVAQALTPGSTVSATRSRLSALASWYLGEQQRTRRTDLDVWKHPGPLIGALALVAPLALQQFGVRVSAVPGPIDTVFATNQTGIAQASLGDAAWLSASGTVAWQATAAIAIVVAWVSWLLSDHVERADARRVDQVAIATAHLAAGELPPVAAVRLRAGTRWFGGVRGVWARFPGWVPIIAAATYLGNGYERSFASTSEQRLYAVGLIPALAIAATVAVTAVVVTLHVIVYVISIAILLVIGGFALKVITDP